MAMLLWLFTILVVLLVLWYIKQGIRRRNGFPGPLPLPIIGNALQIAAQSKYPTIAFQKLSKIYGDVFSIQVGVVDALVFNSYDSLQEIMNHELGYHKCITLHPLVFIRVGGKLQGIALNNGSSWKTLRTFSIRTLRDLGFGKAAEMDEIIGEEIEKFMTYLNDLTSQRSDGAVESSDLFMLTFVNILWRLVTGTNYSLDDPKITHLVHISSEWVRNAKLSLDISAAFPFIWNMFPSYFGKDRTVKNINEIHQFLRDTFEEHRRTRDYVNNPQCYVDVFLKKIKENANNPNTDFTDDQLVICMLDLFQAGSDASAKTLSFAILYMVLHPHIQEKVHKELDQVLSRDEIATIDKKAKLPYTHAVCLETLRYSTVVPFAPPTVAPEDFLFRNRVIKKGTILMSNMEAVNKSETLWGDPLNFRPERFLIKDTNVVDTQRAGKIMSFSTGKRVCMGQALAEVKIFMYLATILRRFKVCTPPGEPDPPIDPLFGIGYSPHPFYACFLPRK